MLVWGVNMLSGFSNAALSSDITNNKQGKTKREEKDDVCPGFSYFVPWGSLVDDYLEKQDYPFVKIEQLDFSLLVFLFYERLDLKYAVQLKSNSQNMLTAISFANLFDGLMSGHTTLEDVFPHDEGIFPFNLSFFEKNLYYPSPFLFSHTYNVLLNISVSPFIETSKSMMFKSLLFEFEKYIFANNLSKQ